jgi:phospholipid/cholesterol/gamma-HCH transport system substrate-binding protein
MRSNKINYFVVGLFVIAILVGLVMLIAVLTGRTGAADRYHAIYRNVTGVKFGTQVMYEGYPIGQVEKVTPMPEKGGMRFRVDLSVNQGWRIPEDSMATIAAPGLLSAITISIAAGASELALKPGSQVKSQEAANIFAVFSSVAGELSALAEQNVKPLLINLNQVVKTFGDLMEKDGKTVFQDVSALVKESAALVQDLSRRAPIIADNIQDFSERMKQNSAEVSALLTPDNRARVERALANLDEAAKNLDQLLALTRTMVTDNRAHVDKSISNMRYVVESVARHVDAINQNMEGAARNMYEFTRQIRQNPGLLLGGTPPKDTAPAR